MKFSFRFNKEKLNNQVNDLFNAVLSGKYPVKKNKQAVLFKELNISPTCYLAKYFINFLKHRFGNQCLIIVNNYYKFALNTTEINTNNLSDDFINFINDYFNGVKKSEDEVTPTKVSVNHLQLDDVVYFMNNNCIHKGKITGIYKDEFIMYAVTANRVRYERLFDEVFKSVDELVNKLKSQIY